MNHILNARAALQSAANKLRGDEDNWLMYLEEDVRLTPELAAQLAALLEIGAREHVDCWYLCNRKNPVARSFEVDGLVVNELADGACGSHALLLPQRHLTPIVDMHWGDLADRCIFRRLGAAARIWQVVSPVLAEHTGEISTFNPEARQKLEINVCN